MSNRAITWAYKQRSLGDEPMKAGAKSILVALADFADQEHSCFPTVALLADMTSMSVSSVKHNIAALIGAGLVSREERRRADGSRTSNRYYLAVSSPAAASLPQGPDSGPGQEPDSGPLNSRILAGAQPDSGRSGENPQDIPHLNPHSPAADTSASRRAFDQAYAAWPKKVRAKEAWAAFQRAAKTRGADQLRADIVRFGEMYSATTELQFVPALVVWLNREGWNDALPAARTHTADGRLTPTERAMQTLAIGRAMTSQMEAKEAIEEACARGDHKWLPNGSCNHCTARPEYLPVLGGLVA